MSTTLHRLNDPVVDGENNPVQFDVAYTIRGAALSESIAKIIKLHGPEIYFLPLSGMSGGGGIFQNERPSDGTIVGLHIASVANPRVSRMSGASLRGIANIALDEIVIDESGQCVIAGAAITLHQLNQTLAHELGAQFKVLGADLTSYTYAQTGATFMTGGMGPQRRYFSDSVSQVALHNGEKIISVEGDDLHSYAGTYGWTGLVSAVRCTVCELPRNEIAFAIPANNSPQSLAKLLQHFTPCAYFETQDGKPKNTSGADDLILGLEHITRDAMQPMFAQSANSTVTGRARQLMQKCEAAEADGLIFVNGYSDKSIDDFLLCLVDDDNADEPTIAGISLEHTEVFTDPELMRAVREAIPAAARTQMPQGAFVFKGHTDANIRLNPDKVETAMTALWQANERYVSGIQEYFDDHQNIRGQILVYGHLNPYGVDPHNRLTFASDDKALFDSACEFMHKQRKMFFHTLKDICEATDSIFIGGEKGAGSEHEIFDAFSSVEQSPDTLVRKVKLQSSLIKSASKMFSWRAFKPYK